MTDDAVALRQLAERYALACGRRDAELLKSLFVGGGGMTIPPD